MRTEIEEKARDWVVFIPKKFLAPDETETVEEENVRIPDKEQGSES